MTVGKLIDISGGRDGNDTRRNEIYMFKNNDWVLASHMISPRDGHAVTTITFDKELESYCIPFPPSTTTTTMMSTTTTTTTTEGNFIKLSIIHVSPEMVNFSLKEFSSAAAILTAIEFISLQPRSTYRK